MDELKSINELYYHAKMLLNLRRKTNTSRSGNFTVFTALRNETDEEKAHTTFLYEILRPDGLHGMGDIFLNDFFTTVLGEHYQPGAKVNQEYHIDSNDDNYGIPDLCIETSTDCFPVEIKIYAQDQPKQIERYFEFAKRKSKTPKVYYLTLDGHEPTSRGKCNSEHIVCISFADDIHTWLTNCAKKAKDKPDVVAVITQYLSLIEKLTNEQQDDVFMDAIVDLIGHSKENYECAIMLSKKLNAVRTAKMMQVFHDIKDYLENNHLIKNLTKEYSFLDQNINSYYSRKKNKSNRLLQIPKMCFEIKRIGDLRIFLCVEIHWYLYYCVFFTNNSWDSTLSDDQKNTLKNAFDNPYWKERINGHAWKNWYVWGRYLPNFKKELNFHEVSELYPELYDAAKYKQIMDTIYKEFDDNLESIINTGFPKDPSNIVTWQ